MPQGAETQTLVWPAELTGLMDPDQCANTLKTFAFIWTSVWLGSLSGARLVAGERQMEG